MNIPHLRKKLGMTQDAFARYIGVHPLTVSRWERGATEPSKPILLLLAFIEVVDSDLVWQEAMIRAWGKTAWRKTRCEPSA